MGAIVLCRHGATESNAAGQFLSRTDVPLSELGRIQAGRLKRDLEDFAFERCLVSPMRRCLETRDIAAPQVPFKVEGALREVDFGDWEGKTVAWLEANDAQRLALRRRDPVHFRPPAGESFEDVAQRLHGLAASLADARGLLVVGHRGTLGVLERLLRGLPLTSAGVTPLEPGELRVVDPKS